VRAEEVDGVVTPVIDEAHAHQTWLGDKHVNRKELDRIHADLLQVGNRGWVTEGSIGTSKLIG
jgi:hypothetical protein